MDSDQPPQSSLPGASASTLDPKTEQKYQRENILNYFIISSCGYFYRTAWHHLKARTIADTDVYMLCLGGRGWFQHEDSYHEVSTGDIICCHRGIAHSYGSHPRDPWSIRWMHCSGEHSLHWLQTLGFSPQRQIIHNVNTNQAAKALQRALHILLQGHSYEHVLMASTAAQQSLAFLVSTIQEKSSGHDVWSTLQQYIQQYKDRHHSLQEMAEHCQLSIPHLSRICRKHSGMSPIEYVTFIKMQHAAELLLSSNNKIKHIAQELGYDDQYYFSRIFKHKHGISPQGYRQSQRQ